MTTETFGLMSCPSGRVPESKLSHNPKAQYGFMLKPSRHRGKNRKNQERRSKLVDEMFSIILVISVFQALTKAGVFDLRS